MCFPPCFLSNGYRERGALSVEVKPPIREASRLQLVPRSGKPQIYTCCGNLLHNNAGLVTWLPNRTTQQWRTGYLATQQCKSNNRKLFYLVGLEHTLKGDMTERAIEYYIIYYIIYNITIYNIIYII
jgi:hypothetical protein